MMVKVTCHHKTLQVLFICCFLSYNVPFMLCVTEEIVLCFIVVYIFLCWYYYIAVQYSEGYVLVDRGKTWETGNCSQPLQYLQSNDQILCADLATQMKPSIGL